MWEREILAQECIKTCKHMHAYVPQKTTCTKITKHRRNSSAVTNGLPRLRVHV